jgi:hypothetical protein
MGKKNRDKHGNDILQIEEWLGYRESFVSASRKSESVSKPSAETSAKMAGWAGSAVLGGDAYQAETKEAFQFISRRDSNS